MLQSTEISQPKADIAVIQEWLREAGAFLEKAATASGPEDKKSYLQNALASIEHAKSNAISATTSSPNLYVFFVALFAVCMVSLAIYLTRVSVSRRIVSFLQKSKERRNVVGMFAFLLEIAFIAFLVEMADLSEAIRGNLDWSSFFCILSVIPILTVYLVVQYALLNQSDQLDEILSQQKALHEAELNRLKTEHEQRLRRRQKTIDDWKYKNVYWKRFAELFIHHTGVEIEKLRNLLSRGRVLLPENHPLMDLKPKDMLLHMATIIADLSSDMGAGFSPTRIRPFVRASVYKVDEVSNTMVLMGTCCLPKSADAELSCRIGDAHTPLTRLSTKTDCFGWNVARAMEPLIESDTANPKLGFRHFNNPRIHSIVGLPFRLNGQDLASYIVTIDANEKNYFTQDHLPYFQNLTRILAMRLKKALYMDDLLCQ